MAEKMTDSELAAVVGATDTRPTVHKVASKLMGSGCGCGAFHGAACPAAR